MLGFGLCLNVRVGVWIECLGSGLNVWVRVEFGFEFEC